MFEIFSKFQFYLPMPASLYKAPDHNLYQILVVLTALISDCKNAHPPDSLPDSAVLVLSLVLSLTWPSGPICMVHVFVIFSIFQFYLPVAAILYTTLCHDLYHILGVLNKLISDCKNAYPLTPFLILLFWYFYYFTDNNLFIYTPRPDHQVLYV